MRPQGPEPEQTRLEVLKRYRILDTSPEQSFDDLAAMLAIACGVSIAAISFIDARRQWFKAKVGWSFSEISREEEFCRHTIQGSDLVVVYDALTDPRFSTSPLVLVEPRVRFYAGASVITGDGHLLGVVSAMDRFPRNLKEEQKNALRAAARLVLSLLELKVLASEQLDRVDWKAGDMTPMTREEMAKLPRLTPRQREILRLIALGHHTKNIAKVLGVSVKTVETHRAQVMRRLEIRGVAGLVRWAIRMGLVGTE